MAASFLWKGLFDPLQNTPAVALPEMRGFLEPTSISLNHEFRRCEDNFKTESMPVLEWFKFNGDLTSYSRFMAVFEAVTVRQELNNTIQLFFFW